MTHPRVRSEGTTATKDRLMLVSLLGFGLLAYAFLFAPWKHVASAVSLLGLAYILTASFAMAAFYGRGDRNAGQEVRLLFALWAVGVVVWAVLIEFVLVIGTEHAHTFGSAVGSFVFALLIFTPGFGVWQLSALGARIAWRRWIRHEPIDLASLHASS